MAEGAIDGAGADVDAVRRSLDEPQAFGLVFEQHATTILRFLVRRLGPADAEVALADVFRIAFERRAAFDTARALRPWLYGIAANVVAKHHRSEGRRLAALARYAAREQGAADDPGDRAVAAVDAGRANTRLVAALASLRPEERAVVLLYAWEDLSYQDLAVALDVPIGTVRSRLNRARTKLRAALDDHDDCSEERG